MKVILNHRRFGTHSFIKEAEIEGTFRRYGKVDSNGDYTINEEKLIKALQKNFLNSAPDKTLLIVQDGKHSITAVSNLKLFKSWAKYFNSNSLQLVRKH